MAAIEIVVGRHRVTHLKARDAGTDLHYLGSNLVTNDAWEDDGRTPSLLMLNGKP
jgi:hypothetical protein